MELKAKQIRRHLKISRAQIAQHFGVSVDTVGRWETEPDALKLDTAVELAKLYGVTLDQLAGLEPLPQFSRHTVEYGYAVVGLTDDERSKVEAFAQGLKAARE